MVERLLVRDLLGFDLVELEFSHRLVVFSGPSGSGKSVLLSALLNLFGHDVSSVAKLSEINYHNTFGIGDEDLDIDEDMLVVRSIKKDKQRFFINAQAISKKRLYTLFSSYVSYLSVRDGVKLDTHMLLKLIDKRLEETDESFAKLLRQYRNLFDHYTQKQKEYETLLLKQQRIEDEIAFLRFEIDKIEQLDPKPKELEQLMETKKRLSVIDKLEKSAHEVQEIFRYEEVIDTFYHLTNKQNIPLIEGFTQLHIDIEEALNAKEELEGLDIEALLDRISALHALERRHGSIQDALSYKEAKLKELSSLESIEETTQALEQTLQTLRQELEHIAQTLSTYRKQEAKRIESDAKVYLHDLKLPQIIFEFTHEKLSSWGIDRVDLRLQQGARIQQLSGGEFNRLRLVLLSVSSSCANANQGILILDEIDANVSGDESIAIAHVLKNLSQRYQIFAISHQPHLCALADTHIAVVKKQNRSSAHILDEIGRIDEIARIIGGENPQQEAVEFARTLRMQANNYLDSP